MIRFASMIIFIFLIDSSIADEKIVEKPHNLLQLLHSNDGWDLVNSSDDDITLHTKSIDDMKLAAFMVKKKTNIPIKIIRDIIMDVRNYGNYFSKNQSFIFRELNTGIDWIDGHQFLPVNIPLIKDREYYFRVYSNGHNALDTTSIVHWYLTKGIEYEDDSFSTNYEDTIYLDYGAGLWIAEPSSDNSYVLSYRLYLDPGGSIPEVAIGLMNKANIMNIFKDVISEASLRTTVDIP